MGYERLAYDDAATLHQMRLDCRLAEQEFPLEATTVPVQPGQSLAPEVPESASVDPADVDLTVTAATAAFAAQLFE
ncbi:MAG: hypothetical protein HZY75_11380 [Nocardioidaceae bacterium]|nr:MAG: hypothetical protein HZY75_11380 [Nocardioidaceae bacterium]